MSLLPPENPSQIDALLYVMRALRDPQEGCPWDREQNFSTIAPYTIEEAYEVADAIERSDMGDLKDELGDLLLQVVYHARMAEEGGFFAFADVVKAIVDKMVRRHPHVFGEHVLDSSQAQSVAWEDHKKAERLEKKGDHEGQSILHDVPRTFPALARAQKLQKRAASVGFDWPNIEPVKAKIMEELAELEEASGDQTHSEEEMGDLLFACVNLARHLKIDAETALAKANLKFSRRFAVIEEQVKSAGLTLEDTDLATLDYYWCAAKKVKST